MTIKIEKAARTSYFKWVVWAFLILILTIIIVLVILYVIACNVGYVYTILIDAGSTSSKLTVFKWIDWPFKVNGYIEDVEMRRVKPGISAYSDKPSEAYDALLPHIKNLSQQYIPEGCRNSTRMFLAATAGMRLLTLENPLRAEMIVEDLQLQLPQTGLMVNNPYSDVRIMSGRDEGIYAWITVNYLAKKLGRLNVPPVNEDQTVGALDLGGASTQITFVSDSNKPAPYTSIRYLYGKTYNIYSYSYLCFGKSAAENRIWAEIIQNHSDGEIINPCLHRNNRVIIKTKTLFKEQCISSKYALDLIGSILQRDERYADEITFVGTGEPTECRDIVEKMFPTPNCSRKPCMFNGVYRPNLRGDFYAISGFTYVTQHLDFPSPGQKQTKDDFRKKVDDFCSKSWEEVIASTPSGLLEYVGLFCFDGVYIDALLSHLGFNSSDSWKSIIFSSNISGVTASWAPGYAIDASGMIESKAPKIKLGQLAFVASVIVLSVIFIFLLGIVIQIFLLKQ